MNWRRVLLIYGAVYAAVSAFAYLVPPQPLPAPLRALIAAGIASILAAYYGRKAMP